MKLTARIRSPYGSSRQAAPAGGGSAVGVAAPGGRWLRGMLLRHGRAAAHCRAVRRQRDKNAQHTSLHCIGGARCDCVVCNSNRRRRVQLQGKCGSRRTVLRRSWWTCLHRSWRPSLRRSGRPMLCGGRRSSLRRSWRALVRWSRWPALPRSWGAGIRRSRRAGLRWSWWALLRGRGRALLFGARRNWRTLSRSLQVTRERAPSCERWWASLARGSARIPGAQRLHDVRDGPRSIRCLSRSWRCRAPSRGLEGTSSCCVSQRTRHVA